ncbi:hypothetical protein [Nitrospira moscoviensis]|nr:hypothetical protein [Nitrospira moscoviensis]
MRKQYLWAMMLATALFAQGCATFQLTQEPFTPKGKKLAVIAGLTNPSSLDAAQALAYELTTTSQFQVMPQKQVAQAIPNYPQLIKGPYNSAYFEIDVDYAKTDVERVKQLHKNLGTDYLYVLWAPTVTTNGQKSWFTKDYAMMKVVAQLYEFPGGKEVGHGTYMMRVDPGKNQIVRDDLQRVTKELAEKTHMVK